MLYKTIKQAYLIDAAIPTNLTAPSARDYRLERRADKNMATENGLYNAVSTSHNRFILHKLHESLKLLNLRFGLCILTQKAVILSTFRTVIIIIIIMIITELYCLKCQFISVWSGWQDVLFITFNYSCSSTLAICY
jgi:hypothetical protein